MTTTISRLYDDPNRASQVVRDLEAAGVASSDISIIASNVDNWYRRDRTLAEHEVQRGRDASDDRAEAGEAGAGIGAVLGGAAGLLAGLGVMAIPGIGPVVAAGWLASTAAGALAGGAAGGIIGALTTAGASPEEADIYAEGIRRGGTLVSARVPDGERARYEQIMDNAAVNIRERADAYRESGWKGFDPDARSYDDTGTRREGDAYRTPSVPR